MYEKTSKNCVESPNETIPGFFCVYIIHLIQTKQGEHVIETCARNIRIPDSKTSFRPPFNKKRAVPSITWQRTS